MTTIRPKTTDFDGAGDDLEEGLANVLSLAKVLTMMGGEHDDCYASSVIYLGERLRDHYDEIFDAHKRIFGLANRAPPGTSGWKRENRSDDDDAGLFALIAEYRRQERELNTPKGRADEEVHRLSDELRAVRHKLNKVRPITLRGVLAVFELGSDSGDMHWWPAEAIEGLREIVAREARS